MAKLSISLDFDYIAPIAAVSAALLSETHIWLFKPILWVFGYGLITLGAIFMLVPILFKILSRSDSRYTTKVANWWLFLRTMVVVGICSVVFHHYGYTYLEYTSASIVITGLIFRVLR